MYFVLLSLILLHSSTSHRIPDNPAVHFHLHRRGSRFSRHEPANLTHLAQVLAQTEEKYSWTYRDVEKNRLVRRWKTEIDEHQMLDRAGLDGNWYFNLEIGQPSQTIEVDLDMLSPDFYSIMTTAAGGSKFDSYQSGTHESSQTYVHPICRLATDVFHLSRAESIALQWPICQASHSTRHTLEKSGMIIGLAPHGKRRKSTLSRIDHASWLDILYQSQAMTEHIWSITLLDSTSGVLSLGSTLAKEMEIAKARPELELKYIDTTDGQMQVEHELGARLALLGRTIQDQFKWLDVRGSAGLWTGLIRAIWIDGIKIMKNQPFLLDVNCPYILAPNRVFDHFYDSVSGSRFLGGNGDNFAAFPCLHPPRITFELAGWQFSSMQQVVKEDAFHGPAGGAFSLGKVNDLVGTVQARNESDVNSGFCVGAVVKTSMGERPQWQHSGVKGVWVLGEPFFRGLGVVFDLGKTHRIGFRSY